MTASIYEPAPGGVVRRPLDRLLHLLLPAGCLACARPLPAAASPLGLCVPCRGRLRPPSPGCLACGSPAGAGPRCAACLARPPAYGCLAALWSYRPPLDAVVAGLKFRRLDYLGGHLAAAMAEGLGGALAGADIVVPVPLHWRRRLARGYNQAERIARPLAGHLGLPFADALARRRATPPQTSFGRAARLASPALAFAARRGARLEGRRVLLVDDVATTGATLAAAAVALYRAGAAGVAAAVAARTPDPGT